MYRVVRMAVALAQAFLENMLRARITFSTIVCDAEIAPKFRHGSRAIADCLMDSTFGDIIADANNHDGAVIAKLTVCPT